MTALQYASAIASGAASGLLNWTSQALQPIDPLYETYKSTKSGKTKHRRRPLPSGLTHSEREALKKVRMRAHFLDEGESVKKHRFEKLNVKWHRLCVNTGVMVHGRDSIIEVTGPIKDVLLYYSLIMRPAMAAGIPYTLRHRMLLSP